MVGGGGAGDINGGRFENVGVLYKTSKIGLLYIKLIIL